MRNINYAAIVAESTVLSISQLAEKYDLTESEICFILKGGHWLCMKN